MRRKFILLQLLLTITISLTGINDIRAQGYLHRSGNKIVNGSDNEIILRSIGLGGWMIQEGYMLQTSSFANAQHEIRKKIEDLIGVANTDTFYTAWLANDMRKIDVDTLASIGFNSIRLPMHYNLFTLSIQDEPASGQNTWLPKGFAMVDSLLAWCKEDHIYLILDLHAAPGGQGSDAGISDYDASKPSLWTDARNRAKTVALWKKLAERYANEEWIGGYDLINEPNWTLPGNTMLRQLYIDITDSIRTVDNNHILFIEGNWYANDFTGLTPAWDNNMAYSFHKYWSKNDQASIQWVLNIRSSNNMPLWCGESGENSNPWYTDAIALFEKNHIGWSWWPWKKFSSTSGITSVKMTNNYRTLLSYWSSGGNKPTVAFAKSALMEMTENLKLENCILNISVTDAMFREVDTTSTIPFAEHFLPGVLFASDYDFGRISYAYNDVESGDYHVSTGSWTGWNDGYAYRNDGVDIETNTDNVNSNGFDVERFEATEWMKYTVNIDTSASYKLRIRYKNALSGTKIHFESDSLYVSPEITLTSTSWASIDIDSLELSKGIHYLKIFCDEGMADISSYSFMNPVFADYVSFKPLAAIVSKEGSDIYLSLNNPLKSPFLAQNSDFALRINGTIANISNVTAGTNSDEIIDIQIADTIYRGDNVTLDYTGNDIQNSNNKFLQLFSNLNVLNTATRHLIPGKIEAENYDSQSGLVPENCAEGGLDLGYTDASNYLFYLVDIKKAGNYDLSVRVAGQNSGGNLIFSLYNQSGISTAFGTISISQTGGWQTWQTQKKRVALPAGQYKMYVYIGNGGFNLNWISFAAVETYTAPLADSNLEIYPNPSDAEVIVTFPQSVNLNGQLSIYNSTGALLSISVLSIINSNTYSIDIHQLNDGIYFMKIKTSDQYFTTKFIVKH